MGRGHWNDAKSNKKPKTQMKAASAKRTKAATSIANVNSNHSSDSTQVNSDVSTICLQSKQRKLKEKHVEEALNDQDKEKSILQVNPKLTHSFEFEEEGDQIVMEINDGGAAANEFTSEDDK